MKKLRMPDHLIRTSMIIIYLFTVSLLAGCGEEPQTFQESITDNVSAKAGTVQLYHVEDKTVRADEERYQLKQPDNLADAVKEVIEAMTLDEGIGIEKYLIDDDRNITLYMHFNDDMTAELKLLNEAALIKSLDELDIESVNIILLDADGREIDTATYTDSSFYYYED